MSSGEIAGNEAGREGGAVFVSYSREDEEFVRRLSDRLAERGHPCWIDQQGIRPTASWMDEVRAAIEAAPAVVFVVSPASAESAVCLKEVGHAEELRKRVLPVVRAEVPPESLPAPIATRHWVSMRPDDDFDRGLDELLGALDTEPEWAAAHTRFLLRAAEWERNGRDPSFVLRGRDLAAAERWLTEADERKDPQPAHLHTEYIIASRRAATRSQRVRMAVLGAGLLVTAALAVFALIQKNSADQRAREARSRELAARALLDRASDPEVGLLYAVEAARIDLTPEAELAMRQLLPESHATGVLSTGSTSLKNAVLSPDGRHAAAVGKGDGWIWAMPGEGLAHRLKLGPGPATDVTFNRRGTELLTTTAGGSIVLWDVRSGKPLRRYRGLGGAIESAAFSPDGGLVAAGGTRGAAVWRLDGGKVSDFDHHRGTIWGVSFGPDGRRVVSAGGDGTVRVWSARTGAQKTLLPLDEQPGLDPGVDANSAVFSPDGREVLTSSDDGAARIWSLASRRVVSVLPASANVTYEASFSADGRRAVTASLDGEARVWDTTEAVGGPGGPPRRARLLNTLHALGGQVLSASFGPGDHTVIAGESGGAARIWDTAGFDRVASFPEGGEGLGADYSPDGRRVVTADYGKDVRVWDPRSGRTLFHLPRNPTLIGSVEFSPGGGELLSGDNGGAARIWNAEDGARVATLQGPPETLYAAAFSPDGRRVATAGAGGLVRVWEVATRAHSEFPAGQGYVSDVAFSPDGRALVTAGENGVKLWKAAGHDPLVPLRSEAGEMVSAAFSPDGETVAAGGTDQTVGIWEVASGRRLQLLRGPTDELLSVAFNPSGTEVAAAGRDRLVWVWDTRSGQLLESIRGPRGYVGAIAFSPDGRSILATSYDHRSYVMRCRLCVSADRLQRLASDRVDAALTARERAQYREEAEGG